MPMGAEEQALAALLVARRIKVTPQRLALLREIVAVGLPISQRELMRRLRRANVDKATIFRNTRLFARVGLLSRVQLGDAVGRFVFRSEQQLEPEPRAHFVCSECGKVERLRSTEIAIAPGTVRGCVLDVQLRGRCIDCASS